MIEVGDLVRFSRRQVKLQKSLSRIWKTPKRKAVEAGTASNHFIFGENKKEGLYRVKAVMNPRTTCLWWKRPPFRSIFDDPKEVQKKELDYRRDRKKFFWEQFVVLDRPVRGDGSMPHHFEILASDLRVVMKANKIHLTAKAKVMGHPTPMAK